MRMGRLAGASLAIVLILTAAWVVSSIPAQSGRPLVASADGCPAGPGPS